MSNSPYLESMFDAMRKSLNAKFERLQGTLPPWTTLLLLMQQAVGKRSIGYTALLASMLVSCGKHLGWDADHAPHESSFCRARVKFTDDMLDKIALVAWKVVEPQWRELNGSIYPASFSRHLQRLCRYACMIGQVAFVRNL